MTVAEKQVYNIVTSAHAIRMPEIPFYENPFQKHRSFTLHFSTFGQELGRSEPLCAGSDGPLVDRLRLLAPSDYDVASCCWWIRRAVADYCWLLLDWVLPLESVDYWCCIYVFSQQCSEEEGESGGTSASGKIVSARRDSVCETLRSVGHTFNSVEQTFP